jgi:hypothetical protein
MIIYPTDVDPVNDILSTNLCWQIAYPVGAYPDKIFITPGGNPA